MGLVSSLLLTGVAVTAWAERRPVANVEEFRGAVQAARPGDVIVMDDGTWQDVVLRFDATGDEDRPITLCAQTPGKVILAGSSQLYIGGDHLVVEGLQFAGGASASGGHVIQFRSRHGRPSHHCRLTDCAIIDYSPRWPDSDEGTRRYSYVVLFGTYNRVDHCRFSGHNNSGVTVCCVLDEEPDFHRIDHNYFGPREAPPPGIKQRNGYETIRIGTSTYMHTNPQVTVEDNYFWRCNGEGEIISNKSHENVYRNNVFVECEGALTLRQGSRCVIDGNYFFGRHKRLTGGVRVTGEDHLIVNNYFHQLEGTGSRAALCMMNGVEVITGETGYIRPKNVVVAFNTFVECRQTMILGYNADVLDEEGNPRYGLPPERCTLANNVFIGGGTDPIVTRLTEPKGLAWQGNVAFGSPFGIPVPPGVVLANPRLEPDEDGLMRPESDSPLVDAARGAYPRVRIDLDGQGRVGRKDVGADEVSHEPATRRRPTPATVGPRWMRPRRLAAVSAGERHGSATRHALGHPERANGLGPKSSRRPAGTRVR